MNKPAQALCAPGRLRPIEFYEELRGSFPEV
jgi:hypothetical protein